MNPYDNLLSQAGSEPSYVRQIYDEWASDYDRNLADWGYEAPVVGAAKLRAMAGDAVGAAAVLDAGCGTGLTGEALRAAGFQTIDGADLSEDSLALAGQRGIYRDLSAVDFTQLPSPLTAGGYDAVFCVGVMSYLPDTGSMVREFCRLTKPGGPILLTQRSDIFDDRGDAETFAMLETEGLLKIVEITGPMPYLPGNPEFVGVGVRYCSFERV